MDIETMSPEDKAVYESLMKKYSEAQPEASKEPAPPLHPDVKKALEEGEATKAELEELKKSYEISQLETAAKKYEVIGKKAEELAPKLYELKKGGATAYDDYIALLDEQIEMVEKSGIFKEIGSNRTGNSEEQRLNQRIEEIRKSEPSLSYEGAYVKAYEETPKGGF